MFEWNEPEQRLEALHHPFTAPKPEDMDDLPSARALAYDMVYNGVEIGGGSLRIYKRDVQEKVLEIIGISPEEVRVTFFINWKLSILLFRVPALSYMQIIHISFFSLHTG
jgi:aspartyl-tRNA synthetase